MSINPSLVWNALEPSLQAGTILGQQSSGGTLYNLCQESDHPTSHCALAPLQQQLHLSPTPQSHTQQLSTTPPSAQRLYSTSVWLGTRAAVSGHTAHSATPVQPARRTTRHATAQIHYHNQSTRWLPGSPLDPALSQQGSRLLATSNLGYPSLLILTNSYYIRLLLIMLNVSYYNFCVM